MMHPEEWAQVKALFEAAAAVSGADREQFLASATDDPALLREVHRLLSAHDEPTPGWVDRLSGTIADHVSLRPRSLPDRQSRSSSVI